MLPRRDKIVTAISKLLLSFVCLMHPSAQAEFAKVNPEMVASLLEPMLWAELQELYPMIANKHTPDLWNRLPTGLQEACITRGRCCGRGAARGMGGAHVPRARAPAGCRCICRRRRRARGAQEPYGALVDGGAVGGLGRP